MNNKSGWVLLVGLFVGLGWFFWPTIESVMTPPQLPLPDVKPPVITNPLATPTEVVQAAATAAAQNGIPVPPDEYAYIRVGDLTGLQNYLNDQARDWTYIAQGVHVQQIAGVGQWSTTWNRLGAFDIILGSRTITYTSVWKGEVLGGLDSSFAVPTITLGEDYEALGEPTRSLTQTNLLIQEMGATATVAFTGSVCAVSVTHYDPSPINWGELGTTYQANPNFDVNALVLQNPQERVSYDLWTGESTTGWAPEQIVSEHDYTRQMAAKQGKVVALLQVMNLDETGGNDLTRAVTTSVMPGGDFYESQIEPLFSQELAQLFRVKGFTISVNLTPKTDEAGHLIMCDGTVIIK